MSILLLAVIMVVALGSASLAIVLVKSGQKPIDE